MHPLSYLAIWRSARMAERIVVIILVGIELLSNPQAIPLSNDLSLPRNVAQE